MRRHVTVNLPSALLDPVGFAQETLVSIGSQRVNGRVGNLGCIDQYFIEIARIILVSCWTAKHAAFSLPYISLIVFRSSWHFS